VARTTKRKTSLVDGVEEETIAAMDSVVVEAAVEAAAVEVEVEAVEGTGISHWTMSASERTTTLHLQTTRTRLHTKISHHSRSSTRLLNSLSNNSLRSTNSSNNKTKQKAEAVHSRVESCSTSRSVAQVFNVVGRYEQH